MDVEQLISIAEDKIAKLRIELSKEKSFFVSFFPSAPMRRKLLKVNYERIQAARDELKARTNQSNPPTQEVLLEVKDALYLVTEVQSRNLDRLRLSADSLKKALLTIGSDRFLFDELTQEQTSNHDDNLSWKQHFPPSELTDLLADYDPISEQFNNLEKRNLARTRLARLYKKRYEHDLHNDFSDEMRRIYLFYVSILLPVLLFLLGGSVWKLTPDGGQSVMLHHQLFLLTISGALGATIGRAIRLRNLQECTELQNMGRTFASQIFVGATLACVVFLVLSSGIVSIPGLKIESPDVPKLVTIGFISGFSEPFSLNILVRMHGLISK